MFFLIIAEVIIGCIMIVGSFWFLIQSNKSTKNSKKDNGYSDNYKKLFTSIDEHNQRDLFCFKLIDSKDNLLKRNSGPNPCDECPSIEYVEYCDSIRYY